MNTILCENAAKRSMNDFIEKVLVPSGEAIRSAAGALAQSLGIETSQLWEVGMQKQYADGIFASFRILATGVGFYIAIRFWKLAIKNYNSLNEFVPTIFFALVSLAVLLEAVYSATLHFTAPEWMLAMEIMKMLEI